MSELFYPEESATAHILTKIAGELDPDFEILVLTGPDSYEDRSHHNPSTCPISIEKIVRIWAPKLNKNKLSGRLFRFVLLTLGLGWRTLLTSRKADTVFAVTNPAPLLVALAIIRKIRQFRLVILVHDVFPENAVAAGLIKRDHFLYSLIKKIFDWAYGTADNIITIGRDMSEVIGSKTPVGANKIVLIENWADHPLLNRIPREQSMIASMGLSNHVVIQYAGNIGRAQGILEFVDLVSAVPTNVVRFVFRGSGALSNELRNATSGRENFILQGAYARSDQNNILNACDVALVILSPNMYGLGVPSKTYNILASGKPILFLGPKGSEIYRLVKGHDIGWAFDWNESDQMIKLISNWTIDNLSTLAERGENARRLAETNYTEPSQLSKFKSLFMKLKEL